MKNTTLQNTQITLPAAYMCFVPVTAVHQAVVQKETRAMRQQGITLHLTQSNTTVFLPPLDGLACDRVDRTRGPDLTLVRHHVT